MRRYESACGDGPDENELRIQFSNGAGDLLILIFTPEQGAFGNTQDCDEPELGTESALVEVDLVISGAPDTATFSFGKRQSPPEVFVSDIAVTPA